MENPRTGQEYYCKDPASISAICKVLNLDGGRLQQITDSSIEIYMDMVEQNIDSRLSEYYFTPIRFYNATMPNGNVVKQFPGRIRRIAQYWAAGLLLQSEFQQLETNTSQAAQSYIDDAMKEIHQITTFNQRIEGQVNKSSLGKTFLPNMQPGLSPEYMN